MTTSASILAIIGALMGTGGLVALLQARSTIRHTDATSAKVGVDAEVMLAASITASYTTLVAEMRTRITQVIADHQQCEERLSVLEARFTDFETSDWEASEVLVNRLIDRELRRRDDHQSETSGPPTTRARRRGPSDRTDPTGTGPKGS